MKKVLITGGTGLIGNHLIQLLKEKGMETAVLTRNTERSGNAFYWNPQKKEMDQQSIEWADCIVHLAGANVGKGRWTTKRKQEILDSRIQSTRLLHKTLSATPNKVTSFISASAVGWYGYSSKNRCTEETPPGSGFLADVTHAWESEVNKMDALNIRTVKLRTGVVLAKEGGALPQIATPVKWYVGARLGSGKQLIPWIHIDDLCRLFLFAIEQENLTGSYNAVTYPPVTNRDLTRIIAKTLKKPLFMPAVPPWALKILIGEMSEVVLGSLDVDNQKIRKAGFNFQHTDIEPAVSNLLK